MPKIMKRKELLLLLTLPAMALFACGEKKGESPYHPSSAAEALLSLRGRKNYTVDIEGGNGAKSKLSYTKGGFSSSSESLTYGYENVSGGAVYWENYAGKNVPSEYLLDQKGKVIQDVWGEGLFPSFADFDADSLKGKESETELSITAKSSKLALIEMLGYASNSYASLKKCTASLSEEGNLSISLSFTINSSSYAFSLSVSEVGASRHEAPTTHYVYSEEETRIRELFRANNYTHYYDLDSSVIGTETFTKDYYMMIWDKSYFSSSSSILLNQGMVGIDHKTITGTDSSGNATSKTLYGCYLVTYDYDKGYSANLSFPYNSETADVSVAYNYPGNLALWDDFAFFQEEDEEGYDGSYFTQKEDLIQSVITNFNLTSEIQQTGYTVDSLKLAYRRLDSDNPTITFMLSCLRNGEETILSYRYANFGSTEIAALDKFVASLG